MLGGVEFFGIAFAGAAETDIGQSVFGDILLNEVFEDEFCALDREVRLTGIEVGPVGAVRDAADMTFDPDAEVGVVLHCFEQFAEGNVGSGQRNAAAAVEDYVFEDDGCSGSGTGVSYGVVD